MTESRNGLGMTIVVADDDPDDRLLIEDAFNEFEIPCSIDFVEDGEQLLEYLRREGNWQSLKNRPLPALIILDLNMPRLDGREALKEIKCDNKLRVLPIVVFTTSSSEDDVQATYEAGVNSFLTKPRTFEGLASIIETLNRYWIETVRLPRSSAGT